MIDPSPPFMGRDASGASSTRDVTGERALAFPESLAAERRIQQWACLAMFSVLTLCVMSGYKERHYLPSTGSCSGTSQ